MRARTRSRPARRLLAGALAAAITCGLALAPCAANAQSKTVNVYNWTDYIAPDTVERFEAATGIKVNYDVFDTLEALEAKLLAGRSGYDVIVPTAEPTFARLIKAGALQPIDRARVPNWKGLDPALMAKVEASDPGNRFGAIYLWGTMGLGMVQAKIAALAPNAPLDSWDVLFKPENARRIAPCGITMYDSPIEVIPIALNYLKLDPNSTKREDLQKVEAMLMSIRPSIRAFTAGAIIDRLAAGDSCLAIGFSGDVLQAASRAEEAKNGIKVEYVAPREGAPLWFDMLAIPKDAPNPENAHAFINFLLDPENIAAISNEVSYPNAVPASLANIEASVRDDTNVFPPDEARARFFTVRSVASAAERERNRVWSRFKAGR